jgi:hypothetical protein
MTRLSDRVTMVLQIRRQRRPAEGGQEEERCDSEGLESVPVHL